MKNKLASFCIILLVAYNSNAQTSGIVIQSGISSMYSKDKLVTPSGTGHYGWWVGIDARLLEDDLYFVLGAQYHLNTFTPSSKPEFFSNNDLKMLMFRLGMGFNIFRITDKVILRSKLLGSINFISDSPSSLPIVGYEDINESFLGLTTGLGLTIGAFDVDFEYQHGFINAITEKPDTKFNILSLGLGFHF